jgi:hypothetical protein
MQRIPRIEERPIGYRMPFATIMEPWESFTGRAMKRPHVLSKVANEGRTSKS